MVTKYFSMYDIILVAVPYTHIGIPPLAPAVLKGIAESEGYSVKAIDIGMELYKDCDLDRDRFDYIQEYFIATSYEQFKPDDIKFINDFIDNWAKQLVDTPSRYIGISVFSYFSHLFAFKLIDKIKELDPNRLVVVGGPGCNTNPSATLSNLEKISSFEKIIPFGEFLKKRKLTDYVILGDGEEALVKLLANNAATSTNNVVDYKQTELPFANFDDYDLWKYPGQLNKGYPQLPIFGSKGCVRNCDFCDVNAIQGRFRFRTGSNIVKEMLYLADKYGIRDFNFTDSLVNGSLSSFEEWVSVLAEYNRNNPDKRITWNGSWICRPVGELAERYYGLMAESGCESLTTGFETGSDNVLIAMNKKTNTRAYRYELEQLNKYNIKLIGLFVVGHWAETWEDFLQTCDFLYSLVPYIRSGQVIGINLGGGATILADTPASKKDLDYESEDIWWNKHNPNLTAKERYFRLLLLVKLCDDLKIRTLTNILPWIYVILQREAKTLNDYYQQITQDLTLSSTATDAYKNYETFFNNVLARNTKNHIDLQIEIESSIVSQSPKLEIAFNGEVLIDSTVVEGTQTHNFKLIPGKSNNLKLKFYNKLAGSTIVSSEGSIIKDTYVLIKKIIIDGIDIVTDPDYYYNKLTYIENNISMQPKTGFWMNNAELHLNFDNPFFLDYAKKSNKNSKYSATMIDEARLSSSYYTVDDEIYLNKILSILDTLTI